MIKNGRDHLKDVNESYLEHGQFAITQGLKIVVIGLASIIHGIAPGLLKFYASSRIEAMGEMIKKRNQERANSVALKK
ncbi:MAG: hypothetical protein HRT44_12165 [Bdellovibrionales bacterium]|nr:DUF6356 family protein [Bdellovibrionales bacterium]NQZ19993.1 hypothetical protein [Bdellovibrionales bacterium]